MKNNIFIDCGSHYGQGLNHFINAYQMTPEDWEIVSFEANPLTYSYFLEKNKEIIERYQIVAYNKAVYTYNGEIVLNEETPINEPNTGQGSSVINLDKWKPYDGVLKFPTKSVVKCINFSEFISSLNNENIFVKIDIEGAEFEILEQMIKDDSIKKIKNLHVEFHSNFFSNPNEMILREENIIKTIKENNIFFEYWY